MRLWIDRHAFARMVAIIVAVVSAATSRAAISVGPIITNSVAAEEQRILRDHQAEQSYQEKIRVGKERYNQRQENRAKVIAAMASQLQEREQTVVIHPVVPSEPKMEIPGLRFTPFIAIFAIAVLFFVSGLNRLRSETVLLPKTESIFFPIFHPEPEIRIVPLAEAIFVCEDQGVKGSGRLVEEGFTILKGSVGSNEIDPPTGGMAVTLRAKLLESGIIREEGNGFVFEKDHLFTTPSLAANVLLGRRANGWTEWKTADGMTLDTVQRLQPKNVVKKNFAVRAWHWFKALRVRPPGKSKFQSASDGSAA
jgi:hypothetical protein